MLKEYLLDASFCIPGYKLTVTFSLDAGFIITVGQAMSMGSMVPHNIPNSAKMPLKNFY